MTEGKSAITLLMDTHYHVLLLFVVFIVPQVAPYTTHYLERECLNGSVTLNLSAWGENSAAILMATSHTSYYLQMLCKVRLQAPEGYYLLVSVREIGFRIKTDSSCKDYLEIQRRPLCKNTFRLEEDLHYDSLLNRPPNIMDIIYYTDKDGLDNKSLSGYPGFTITYTAFTKDSSLHNDSFECNNGNRIWPELTCDSHNNCGDQSDEEPKGRSNCGMGKRGSMVFIILGALIVLVMILMCVATLACSKNPTVTRLRRRTLSAIPRLGTRYST
ncbi:uncharacterized protein LOC129967079 [Argiope bruennichi]|uniref:Uncharacterized protein n=1 Tax=Argiope bruennichi TaxID=94029 RepID=A0A8T0E6N7_ARGBR|nr:uncharacterized protein LOC129967079 [Argiope bruennichi]KAF8767008.1 hypothetical protein HNY73_020020 [Argiope bruennichi]